MSSVGSGAKRILFLAAAAVVIVVAIAGTLQYGFGINLSKLTTTPSTTPTGTTPNPSSTWLKDTGGTITLSTIFLDRYNNSETTTSLPTAEMWAPDKTTLRATYDGTNKQLLTKLLPADGGVLYVSLTVPTATVTYYVDKAQTLAKNPSLLSCEAYDTNGDHTLDYLFKYDASKLTALTAGETSKTDRVNLYVDDAEASPSFVSTANVTGVSTTGYNDYYTEGYIDSWTGEGYSVKLAKMQVVFDVGSAANILANATYVEDGNLKLVSVDVTYGGSLGTQSYSGSQISWSLADRKFDINIGVPDVNNEFYGQSVFYGRGAGATFAKVLLHWQAKFPSAGKNINPNVKFYYINPNSVLATFDFGERLAS